MGSIIVPKVPQDEGEADRLCNKALESYRKAANEKSDASAMVELGRILLGGQYGIHRDQDAGLRWYEKAANLGNIEAIEGLGLIYQFDSIVQYDQAKSMHWLSMAIKYYVRSAAHNSVPAMLKIGKYYADGLGVERDLDTAYKWYRRAADRGSIKAMMSIADLYENDGDYSFSIDIPLARKWLEKADRLGSTLAAIELRRLSTWGNR